MFHKLFIYLHICIRFKIIVKKLAIISKLTSKAIEYFYETKLKKCTFSY